MDRHGMGPLCVAPVSIDKLREILIATFGELHVEAPGAAPLFHHECKVFGEGALTIGRGMPHVVREKQGGCPHEKVSVFIVERGRVHIRHAGRSYDVDEDQLTILDQSLDVTIEHMTEYRISSMLIPRRKIPLLPAGRIPSLNRAIATRSGPARILKTLISDLAFIDDTSSRADTSAHWDLACDVFSQMFLELTRHRQSTSPSDRVESRVQAFVDGNYFNADLHHDEIAASVGASLRTINRALARNGSSLARLVMQTRIDHARRLLHMSRRGEASIATIADQVGFKDPGHFSRAFKKHTGMTPGSCRAAKRS